MNFSAAEKCGWEVNKRTFSTSGKEKSSRVEKQEEGREYKRERERERKNAKKTANGKEIAGERLKCDELANERVKGEKKTRKRVKTADKSRQQPKTCGKKLRNSESHKRERRHQERIIRGNRGETKHYAKIICFIACVRMTLIREMLHSTKRLKQTLLQLHAQMVFVMISPEFCDLSVIFEILNWHFSKEFPILLSVIIIAKQYLFTK